MADPHGRFEQLAVGHVLGGLGPSDAADFRSHLVGCASCRNRVAELRDIAADLEAAERDEQQRSRVRTAIPRRADANGATEQGEPAAGITIRHVTIAVVVVLVLAGAMAFWNLHLRTTVAVQSSMVERHTEALRVLATGVEVPATMHEEVRGQVVVDDDQVAVGLVGVADVAPGEAIVGWLLDAEGAPTPDSALLARSGPLDDGLLIGTLTVGDSVELVVTRESGEVGAVPRGERLVEAHIAAGASD